MDKIVLDTNSFVSSISKQSDSYIVWRDLQDGVYTLFVTDEIINEYQEIIEKYTTAILQKTLSIPCYRWIMWYLYSHAFVLRLSNKTLTIINLWIAPLLLMQK